MVKSNRAAGLLAILVALPAQAHPEFSPQLVNRYLSLIALDDRLQFFVGLLYGPLPAVDARKAMDTDGDRKISATELKAAGEAWKKRAPELATMTLDGEVLRLDEARVEVQIGGDDSVGPGPVSVEIYGSRALPPGTRRVRLAPGWDPPRLGETELSIDLAAGWDLVASEQAGRPADQLTRFKLEGPRRSAVEDRSVTFVIRSTSALSGSRALPVALAITALVAAAGLVLELRRRRRLGAGTE